MKRTILYYPTISIPTNNWLRQALLYWDEIGSIVPQRYEDETLIPYSPEIEYLKIEGIFRPFRPDKLAQPGWSFGQFEDELVNIVYSSMFQNILPPPQARTMSARIHLDKISHFVLDSLQQAGLAQLEPSNDEWVHVEPNTALLYMALLARHLANEDAQSTIPGTDRPSYQSLIFHAISPQESITCLTASLHNVLPIPREDMSFADIVEFKRRREPELLRFRQLIDEFTNDLRQCQSKAEAHHVAVNLTERIREGINDLEATIKDSKLATTVGSLNTLVKPDSASLWAGILAAAGQTIKINIPLPIALSTIGALAAVQVSTYLVDKRNEQREAIRHSPLSYLYYAQQEEIVQLLEADDPDSPRVRPVPKPHRFA